MSRSWGRFVEEGQRQRMEECGSLGGRWRNEESFYSRIENDEKTVYSSSCRSVLPEKKKRSDQIRKTNLVRFLALRHFAYLGFSSPGSPGCAMLPVRVCVSVCLRVEAGGSLVMSFLVYPPSFLVFADGYGTTVCGVCRQTVVMRCRQYGGTTLACAHHRYRWLYLSLPSLFFSPCLICPT